MLARPRLPTERTLSFPTPGWTSGSAELDRDGDGYLGYEEMTENLKAEKESGTTTATARSTSPSGGNTPKRS